MPSSAPAEDAAFVRAKREALAAVRDAFRPELLGRLDEVLVFRPLDAAALAAIAEKLLEETQRRCAAAGVRLTHTREAAQLLARTAAGQPYGARELRRAVQRQVEQPLADAVLGVAAPRRAANAAPRAPQPAEQPAYRLCVRRGRLALEPAAQSTSRLQSAAELAAEVPAVQPVPAYGMRESSRAQSVWRGFRRAAGALAGGQA